MQVSPKQRQLLVAIAILPQPFTVAELKTLIWIEGAKNPDFNPPKFIGIPPEGGMISAYPLSLHVSGLVDGSANELSGDVVLCAFPRISITIGYLYPIMYRLTEKGILSTETSGACRSYKETSGVVRLYHLTDLGVEVCRGIIKEMCK